MRPWLRSIGQMLVMAAIVTFALFVPAGALIALVGFALGIPLASLLTFGGALGLLAGLAAWWAILLVPALVYAGWVMPWHAQHLAAPYSGSEGNSSR